MATKGNVHISIWAFESRSGHSTNFFGRVRRKGKKRCPYTYMYVPFHCHICVSPLYENPDGFLGRYAYSHSPNASKYFCDICFPTGN